MPLYEYVCTDCKSKFEIRRSMKEIDDRAECPHCHGDHTNRQMSRVAAFGKDDSGNTSFSSGGGGCGSCGGGTCGTCASRN